MTGPGSLLDRIRRDRMGGFAIASALTAPLMIGLLAIGVDYGAITLQQRKLQEDTDLSAIVAATDMTNAEKTLLSHLARNGVNAAVETGNSLITVDGIVPLVGDDQVFSSYDVIARITRGAYTADPAVPVGQRFVANATPLNAVRVSVREKSELYFARMFTSPGTLEATGTAASQKIAAFSVGSRLLSLDGGVLNGILGGLLGTTISLKVMDYQGLVDANINALEVVDTLAIDLGLKAGTYDDLLETQIGYGQLLDALAKQAGLKPTVVTTLKSLKQALGKTQANFRLEQILNLDPLGDHLIGTGQNLQVTAGVFDLVNAAAVAANGGKQVAVNLGATVPGLASLKMNLAIGEPPVGTPAIAVGAPDSVVRTAQTRLSVAVTVNGLAALAGLKVNVPLYVEVAHAEAKLAGISCFGGDSRNAQVSVDAVPGIAEISLGMVDTTAFANFGTKPRVTRASIVDSALVSINGSAYANIGNLSGTRVNFSPTDIAAAKIKSISTRDTLTSLVQSMLTSLNPDIRILFLTIGTPALLQKALADTLTLATVPIDTVLYNTLLVLGIRVGEADLRVTDVRCQNSTLVQ